MKKRAKEVRLQLHSLEPLAKRSSRHRNALRFPGDFVPEKFGGCAVFLTAALYANKAVARPTFASTRGAAVCAVVAVRKAVVLAHTSTSAREAA